MSNFKCHFCPVCNGTGCISQLPGMGGVNRNINFRLNCDGWEVLRKENPLTFVNFLEKPVSQRFPKIAAAPVTGAVENIGFENEEEFYSSYFEAILNCGIELCVGDGFPDDKLSFCVKAIKKIQKTKQQKLSANFFIKPFENQKIFEHIKLVLPYAKTIGIDIDSFNISTMKDFVKLEKKSFEQLLEIKKFLEEKKVNFALKGIFTQNDIELIKNVRPEIAYISNHGGRVDTRIGSTAEFLQNFSEELHSYSKEVWVDGGIRSSLDVATALAFGADKILVGRPFISSFCKSGEKGVCKKALELNLIEYGSSSTI